MSEDNLNDPPKMVYRSTIIAQRPDYKKGRDIRLISCYTGNGKDGVAQYVANKLGVTVIAPDKKGIIQRSIFGRYEIYSGSDIGIHDGEMIHFEPEKNARRGNIYG